MSEIKYRKKAIENLPLRHFVLTMGDALRRDDLVWSWTSEQWLRADSPEWLQPNSSKTNIGDLICACRRIEISEFEKSVPTKRRFVLR